MFWLKKVKLRRALQANELIHDAVIMDVCDKYLKEENIENNDFALQLLARSLNWAIPNLNYDFENDLNGVEDVEIREKLRQDENQIFKKGLSILNADPLLEELVTYYAAHALYLIQNLSTKNKEEKYPGIKRMKKLLFQSPKKEPDVKANNFKESYKNLLIEFDKKYSQYGIALKEETIDSLLSFVGVF